MSLRSRLLGALIPLFIFCLAAADFGTYTALHTSLVSGIDSEITASRALIERTLEQAPDRGGDFPAFGNQFPQDTYGALYSSSGSLVAERTFVFGTTAAAVKPVLPQPLPAGQFVEVRGTGGVSSFRLWAGPAVDGSGATLLVAVPLDAVSATLNTLLLFELAISAAVTLLMVLSAWYLVRRGLRPLETMAATAQSIAASRLNMRVQPSTEKTEVGRLGLALNSMLSQLEMAFAERERNEQRLRHFVADASHELRTPLTSLRGYAELLQRAPAMDREDMMLAMRRLEEETKRMGVLVDDLLLLARIDQGRPLERAPVDLSMLVDDACADARAAAPDRTVGSEIDRQVTVRGDEMRLRQVLGNLMRNALVHTPAATPIEVRLRREEGRAVLEVADHGPGIPAAQAGRVFERFHRANAEQSADRGGSGLGLSIVAAIVSAHAGEVRLTDTPAGGATFRVLLPLLRSAGEAGPRTAGRRAEQTPA